MSYYDRSDGDTVIHLDRRQLRAVAESASWLVGRRRRIRVVGDSMLPTLSAGQFVLVDERTMPIVGELAVARHPFEDLMVIKRVESIGSDGRFHLLSDNPAAGTDSRTWGPLAAEAICGTVTLLLDRPSARL